MSALQLESLNWTFSDRHIYRYVIHENARLTTSPEAKLDIKVVQTALIELIKLQRDNNKLISTIVLLRVTLTGMKHLGTKYKFAVAFRFLQFCLNWENLKLSVKAVMIFRQHRTKA